MSGNSRQRVGSLWAGSVRSGVRIGDAAGCVALGQNSAGKFFLFCALNILNINAGQVCPLLLSGLRERVGVVVGVCV
eukprot:868927-Rhodomonas_salina.1